MPTRKELAVEHRKQRRIAKERLAALRLELRNARVRRKQALFDAKERCRAERVALRERLRTNRIRVLAELRETGRAERQAVRAACALRRKEARGLGNDMARARAQLAAEHREQAELRKVARAVRVRLAALSSRQETDAEILAALPPDLAPLFERVKGKIKGRGRLSRLEAFLRHAESHPAEVLAASRHAADTRVQELEHQERALAKEAGLKPNVCETKKGAARIRRMRARADQLSVTAEGTCGCATEIANDVLGQPAFEIGRQADWNDPIRAMSSDTPSQLGATLATPEARARTDGAKKAGRSKTPRAIVIENPRDRDHTRHGRSREGETLKDTTVTIVPGRRIEIVHVVPPGQRYVKDPVSGHRMPSAEAYTVRKTFEIGDVAEVGGYNLTYTGVVRGITAKSITVVEHEGTSMEKTYRLSIYLFARMNWDFDAAETARRNSEMSATL